MDSKKGICPISFLWRGEGVIGLIKKASFLAIFFLMSARLFLGYINYQRELLWSFILLWLAAFVMDGAQKRTRTSTKKTSLGPEPSASTNSAIWAKNLPGRGDRI
jgi:hypothetical protein